MLPEQFLVLAQLQRVQPLVHLLLGHFRGVPGAIVPKTQEELRTGNADDHKQHSTEDGRCGVYTWPHSLGGVDRIGTRKGF